MMSEAAKLTIDLSQERKIVIKNLKQTRRQFSLYHSSKDLDWDSLYLAYAKDQSAGANRETTFAQYGILIITDTPEIVNVRRNLDGKIRQEQVAAQDVIIVPPHVTHQAEWDVPGTSWISLNFEPQLLERILYETVNPERLEITPRFAQNDSLIHQLGLQLKAEVESGGLGGRLYADAIINLLAIHLLRHYSTKKPQIKTYSQGLSKQKLQQVIEYINVHLNDSLSLKELASIVHMSPGYFSRLFKQATGFAPHQYVIRCRVRRAKELLSQKRLTIAEVAYYVGFANQAHLNYHFKRIMGITPKAIPSFK